MLVFVIVLSVLGTAYGALPVAVSDSLVTDPYASVTPSSQVYLPVISNTRQPNFVIIVSDDQRYDTIDYMPLTKARIFDQGITFSRAYVTTPICCPSRSSILTGMYAHHHRVYDNYAPLEQPTFVQRLREAGYFTGMVGKYLNSWDGAVRPEFDYWVVFAGHGAAQRYFDPTLNVNGNWIEHTGYMTHILQNYALDFLYRARQRQAPFMLIFAPNAPHEPGDPAPSDEDLYPGLPLYRPPSFMEEDLSDKPVYLQNRPPSNPDYLDALRRKQLQSLHALDITVDNVLTALSQSGQDANTVVMYISDNGVYWGEHRLDGKLYAYDEASHVPFAIRQPDLIPQPRVESRLVANIDIAPTVYELAGLSIPADVDGRSLTPLFKQTAGNWRTSLLIEGWGFLSYTAIQTERYLYIETPGDTSELYDSLDDPYQIDNRYTNPDYATVVSDLHTELTGYMAHVEPAPARIIPFMITALGLDD
jgi:N-acetylglucosamine-6-sulfatase